MTHKKAQIAVYVQPSLLQQCRRDPSLHAGTIPKWAQLSDWTCNRQKIINWTDNSVARALSSRAVPLLKKPFVVTTPSSSSLLSASCNRSITAHFVSSQQLDYPSPTQWEYSIQVYGANRSHYVLDQQPKFCQLQGNVCVHLSHPVMSMGPYHRSLHSLTC